jgi:hypothetical protein
VGTVASSRACLRNDPGVSSEVGSQALVPDPASASAPAFTMAAAQV